MQRKEPIMTTSTDTTDTQNCAKQLEEVLGWPGTDDGFVRACGAYIVVHDGQHPWAARAADIAAWMAEYDGPDSEAFAADPHLDWHDSPYHRLCASVDEAGRLADGEPDDELLLAVWSAHGLALEIGAGPVRSREHLAYAEALDVEVARLVADDLDIDAERVRITPDVDDDGDSYPVATIEGLDSDMVGDTVTIDLDGVDVDVVLRAGRDPWPVREPRYHAEEVTEGWVVRDHRGGVWHPGDDAARRIAASNAPAKEAVAIARDEPMAGEWRS
jgi:hypothetical protein